jgi:hypothetical protein
LTGYGEKINRKKEQAISALLSQPTLKAAAEVAGIGEKTLWRWLQNEDFQDAFMEVRRQLVQQVLSNIQRSMSKAVNTLLEVMDDPDSPASSKVQAARSIIDVGLKGLELEDFELRLSRLEDHLPRATRREE